MPFHNKLLTFKIFLPIIVVVQPFGIVWKNEHWRVKR